MHVYGTSLSFLVMNNATYIVHRRPLAAVARDRVVLLAVKGPKKAEVHVLVLEQVRLPVNLSPHTYHSPTLPARTALGSAPGCSGLGVASVWVCFAGRSYGRLSFPLVPDHKVREIEGWGEREGARE